MIPISIIIPAYNAERYLRECLESIIPQIPDGCEVICVDDGSTDGTPSLLAQYENVHVIRKVNGGVSSARNLGIEESLGEYLWFVDADDLIAPNAVRILCEILKGRKPDIVTFGWTRFRDSCECEFCGISRIKEYDMNLRKQAVEALQKLGGGLWAYNGIYRKDVLSLRFANLPNGEDTLFGYESILSANAIVATDGVLYGYRDNGEGASKKMDERHLRSLMRVAESLNECFKNCRHSKWFKHIKKRHINGIMHTWGIILADRHGAAGYAIWRDTARKVYPLGWIRLLVALKCDRLLWAFTIGVVRAKKAILDAMQKLHRYAE